MLLTFITTILHRTFPIDTNLQSESKKMLYSIAEHGAVTQEEILGTAQKGFKASFSQGGWRKVRWRRQGVGLLRAKKDALNPFCAVSRVSN